MYQIKIQLFKNHVTNKVTCEQLQYNVLYLTQTLITSPRLDDGWLGFNAMYYIQ